MNDWKIYALGSAFFAGLTAVLAKVGVEGLSSNLATLLRTVVILCFLIGIVGWRGEWQNPLHLPMKSVGFLVLSGLVAGLSWICFYRSLQLGPTALVVSIDKLSLLVAVVLAVVFLRERLSITQWVGVALMASGAILVAKR